MPQRRFKTVADISDLVDLRPYVVAVAMMLAPCSATAQSPIPPPTQQSAPELKTEVFGEAVTLEGKPIVFLAGKGTWDNAFKTLTAKFKAVAGFLDKQKLKPAGPMMTVYTALNDRGFEFQAAVPLAEQPAHLPRGDVKAGQSPVGKALKFVYRGSYDSMDALYESITNYIDEKQIERGGIIVEEYETDPLKTPEDKLVVNVFVLVK